MTKGLALLVFEDGSRLTTEQFLNGIDENLWEEDVRLRGSQGRVAALKWPPGQNTDHPARVRRK